MSNTPLSKTWLTRAVITIILTGAVAWVTWASTTTWKHETRITVAETKVDAVKQDISDLKEGQKEQTRKLDEIKTILIRRR